LKQTTQDTQGDMSTELASEQRIDPIHIRYELRVDENMIKRCHLRREKTTLFKLEKSTGEITDGKELKDLILDLKRSKTMSHLSLNLKGCSLVAGGALNQLGSSIEKLRFLKHLELDFSDCPHVNNEGLRSLSQFIKQTRLLKSLNLKFSLCSLITDEGLRVLLKDLRYLLNLEDILLKFNILRIKVLNIWVKSLKNANP